MTKSIELKTNIKTKRKRWLLAAVTVLVGIGLVLWFIFFKPFQTKPVVSSIPLDLGYQAGYEVIAQYPHDPEAFTQGLLFSDGYFYESTGLRGYSSLRKVDIESGKVIKQYDLDAQYFSEGLALWHNQLIQLTWQNNRGFVYDLETFSLEESFEYPTEGWGLTHDGDSLIMSDGSTAIYFLDPQTKAVTRRIDVSDKGIPVKHINELEYIRGEIYANIWLTDRIARIDPQTGMVLGWINLGGLLQQDISRGQVDVLNGIAYDSVDDRLFVTGKLWPYLFEINLINEPGL